MPQTEALPVHSVQRHADAVGFRILGARSSFSACPKQKKRNLSVARIGLSTLQSSRRAAEVPLCRVRDRRGNAMTYLQVGSSRCKYWPCANKSRSARRHVLALAAIA